MPTPIVRIKPHLTEERNRSDERIFNSLIFKGFSKVATARTYAGIIIEVSAGYPIRAIFTHGVPSKGTTKFVYTAHTRLTSGVITTRKQAAITAISFTACFFTGCPFTAFSFRACSFAAFPFCTYFFYSILLCRISFTTFSCTALHLHGGI